MARLEVVSAPRVSARSCVGIDRDPFAAALASLTLWVGERRAHPRIDAAAGRAGGEFCRGGCIVRGLAAGGRDRG
jgi:hypothetical protein